MSRLKGPLLSLGASGRLARAYTLARRLSGPWWLLRGRPADPKTDAQLSWRTMWQLAASLWHDLSADEQAEWESQGTARHMTGFAWYMSQALRPNPGIYLPLAGGTMSGAIQMDGKHIHGLPLPIHVQDVWRRQDFQTYTLPYLYHHAARARRSTNQNLPHATDTYISFDTADYDTDEMWEGVTNPDRVTIKTAGIYLIIGQVYFEGNAAGDRSTWIQHSRLPDPALSSGRQNNVNAVWRGDVTTTYECIVGDYLRLGMYQNTGGAINAVAAANKSSVLQAVRVG